MPITMADRSFDVLRTFELPTLERRYQDVLETFND
jgi:hypothetical protein